MNRINTMKIEQILNNKNIIALKPVLPMVALACICDIAIVGLLYFTANLSYEQSKDRLFILFILTLILKIIVYHQFSKRLTIQVEAHIAGIRLKVMDYVRNTDLRSFEKLGAETIYTALTFDVKSVAEISNLIVFTIKAGISMMVCTIYLAFLSWSAFLLTMLVACITAGFYLHNQFLIKQIIDQVRVHEKKMFKGIKHLLDGFKELKLNDRKNDDFFHSSIKRHVVQLREMNLQVARLYINNYSISLASWKSLILVIVLILPLTGFFLGNILLTFIGLILFMPVSVLIEIAPRFILASFSMHRLYRLEQTLQHINQEITDSVSEARPVEFRKIEYDNISFRYDEKEGRPFVLEPLNLSFKAGEIIFITGGNGSGKSTLLKVLTGLYYTHSGKIILNDREIRISDYRSLFSIVFADFHLFDRFYGLTGVKATRVNELLKLMQLNGKVEFAEDKFSTLNLSAGQKKRMALIVAILEDKPIFVFDEWAADQDPYFKRYFYEELLAEFKAQGKTVIAVTHDDRFFNVADRIFRLDYGRLF